MQHDTLIVGGGFAGLAAATYLARALRDVHVIDAGKPRNRFASASHGFLGQDGSPPGEILAAGRAQLLRYPTAKLTRGEVREAGATNDGYCVRLHDGERLEARTLILAFGLADDLPAIPGLAERWGHTVLHCPYCHGFEFRDKPLGVLYRTEMSVHQAMLVAEWGPTTLFLNGARLDPAQFGPLAARGVAIEAGEVVGLEGDCNDLAAIRLMDGHACAVAALYVSPVSYLSSPIAAQLGVAVDDGPLGPVIRTDANKITSVDRVYAAGDMVVRAQPNSQASPACGSRSAIARSSRVLPEPDGPLRHNTSPAATVSETACSSPTDNCSICSAAAVTALSGLAGHRQCEHADYSAAK